MVALSSGSVVCEFLSLSLSSFFLSLALSRIVQLSTLLIYLQPLFFFFFGGKACERRGEGEGREEEDRRRHK